MEEIWGLMFRGGALGVATAMLDLVCSLVVLVGAVHSLVSRSRAWTLRWAAAGLSGSLVVAALIWAEARVAHAHVLTTAAAHSAQGATDLLLRGHSEVMWSVDARMVLLLLPLVLGIWLLLRGVMLPGHGETGEAPVARVAAEPRRSTNRGVVFVTIGCFAMGMALGLWAMADLNRFGTFIMALHYGL